MDDVIIEGISINELKATKAKIQQGANKVISDSIEQATKVFHEMMEAESYDEAEKLAQQAYDLLETANVVSGVSGVKFSLPYYEEYGQYESDEVMSHILENNEENENVESDWQNKNNIYRLQSLLENMESQACNWYSSKC